jgi:uncharacterized protein (TIGR03663 family)
VYHLELTPLHHDEGVNGYFLVHLFRDYVYRYDPANYHGPTLYYFALPSAYLFGLNTFAIRMVTAAFGVGTVWLALKLRSHLGYPAALIAASLIAVSPGAVYLSRYFIHETLFVFFTLAMVTAALRYHDEPARSHLVIVAVWAALLFATKETALISAAVLLAAFPLAAVYIRFRGRVRSEPSTPAQTSSEWPLIVEVDGKGTGLLNRRGIRKLVAHWITPTACFVLISGLLYSSFLSNPRGVVDALRTVEFWVRTGRSEHTHAWYQYLGWLWQEESPLLVLGAIGAVVAVWRADSRFGIAAALWATALILAYSILPYKTPWLTLNFIIPLALVGSYGVIAICKGGGAVWRRLFAGALVLSALAILAYRSVSLSFYHYDDESYAYVYGHTRREFLSLVQKVEDLAGQSGQGRDISIAVTSTDYWPLPWYLRDYTSVGYYGKVMNSTDALVIGSEGQAAELELLLGEQYQRLDSYMLRPGVNLVIYARRGTFNVN